MVFERGAAVLDELLQGDSFVGDVEVQESAHLLRVVEVQDLVVAVMLVLDVVQQDVHDLEQELPGHGDALLLVVREQGCQQSVFI